MDKRRKGFLKAGTILTIISASIGILACLFFVFASSALTESVVVDMLKSDPEYTYTQESDGGYNFTYVEDGVVTTIDDETLSSMIVLGKVFIKICGVGGLLFAAAQLTLAILILVNVNKGKYKKGCVIALLVLSILAGGML